MADTLNIEKIKLEAFKGQVRDYQLGRRVLLVGDNGSGKTGLLQAAMFACQGHTNLGKRDEDTAALAGPRGCVVSVELSDGFSWTRRLDVKPDGNSQGIHIGGETKLTKAKAQARVDDAVGDFAPMWDVDAFLALSADKRRDFIVDLCAKAKKAEPVDYEDMVRRIELLAMRSPELVGDGTVSEFLYGRYKVERDEDATEEQIKALMRGKLSAPQWVQIDELIVPIYEDLRGDPAEAISAALERAKSLTNAAKAEAEDGQGAALELAAQKSELGERVPAGDVDRLLGEQRNLNDERDGLIDRIATQRERDRRIADAETRRDTVISQLVTSNADLERLEAETIDLSAADKAEAEAVEIEERIMRDRSDTDAANALDKENARIASFKDDRSVKRQEIVAELEKARILVANSEKRGRESQEAIDDNERQKQSAGVASQILTDLCKRHESDSVTMLRNKLRELAILLPPGEERPDIDEIIEAMYGLLDGMQSPDPKLATAELEIKQYECTIERCKESIKRHTKDREAVEETIAIDREYVAKYEKQLAEFDAADAPDDRRAELTQAVNDATRAIDSWRDEVLRKRDEAESIRKNAERQIQAVAAAKAEIDGLGAERVEIETRIQTLRDESTHTIDAMEARQAEVGVMRTDLEAKIKAKHEYEAINRQLLAAKERAESRMLRHEMGKILVKAIKKLREELTRKLTAPLNDLMDRFLSGIGQDIKSYIELDKAKGKKVVFRIGWEMPEAGDVGRRTPIEAMSGGENVIFTAALAYGLLMLADPPLKLLLIEAGEISSHNLDALLQGVEAVSDDIGNALIATHVPVAGQAGEREWQRIDMDQLRNLAAVASAA